LERQIEFAELIDENVFHPETAAFCAAVNEKRYAVVQRNPEQTRLVLICSIWHPQGFTPN
jgi:hypothetical protein